MNTLTTYCVKLLVSCDICEDAMYQYCFTTNSPPTDGNCQVSPTEGMSIAFINEKCIIAAGNHDSINSLEHVCI